MTTPSPEPADAAAALYRQQLLEHGREPRQAGRLEGRARRALASNTLCGDRVAVSLRTDEAGRIRELRHDSQACLLCLASASLMSGLVTGLDAAGVAQRHDSLRDSIREPGHAAADGEWAALAGVAPYPSRHRCVLLPWEALREALEAPESDVSP